MVNKRAVEEWLVKADEDYQYAKASLDEGLTFYDQIFTSIKQQRST